MKKRDKKKRRVTAAADATPAIPLSVALDWNEVILVCSRCANKLDGRIGDKGHALVRGEIREALKARGGKRDARVMETGCFGLCPRGGQVVATASGLRQGKLYVFDGADDGGIILQSLLPAGGTGLP